jgi:hypothetical protein
MLPRFGVTWSADDDSHLIARYAHDDVELALHLALNDDAHLGSVTFDRWGDPDETGAWGLHPFGLDVTGYATFDGVTIPSAGRVGWFHGTDRWADGEFCFSATRSPSCASSPGVAELRLRPSSAP